MFNARRRDADRTVEAFRSSTDEKIIMKQTVLKVSGMKCDGCAKTVEDAVRACAGVSSVKAQFKEGIVEIAYEEGVASVEAIKKAIADKGYVPA